MAWKRRRNSRFVDAPQDQRCKAIVTLSDNTTADCGRYRKVGSLCRQHVAVLKRQGHGKETASLRCPVFDYQTPGACPSCYALREAS